MGNGGKEKKERVRVMKDRGKYFVECRLSNGKSGNRKMIVNKKEGRKRKYVCVYRASRAVEFWPPVCDPFL